MRVLTSGFPKAGNHALVKACQLLGLVCQVNHIEYGEAVAGLHFHIVRDPRNVVLSWLRFRNRPVTPGMFISAFRSFIDDQSLTECMAKYVGWTKDVATHVVRYEALIADESEMRRIAGLAGVPYLSGAFAHLPGMTMTWHADHSDYASIWTPEVDAVWSTEGGTELLAAWGY